MKLEKEPLDNFATKTYKALDNALKDFFNETRGMRPVNVAKNSIVFTDGKCTCDTKKDLKPRVQKFKRIGIRSIAVGIGNTEEFKEDLYDLTYNDNDVYEIMNDGEIEKFKEDFIDVYCNSKDIN